MIGPLWSLADELGVVPMSTPQPLRGLVAEWWEQPRVFGCHRVRGDWFVVCPDVAVCCGACAALRLRREHRCCLCHSPVDHSAEVVVAADHDVTFLALLCPTCSTPKPDERK